jgi:twitching motility protein PilT
MWAQRRRVAPAEALAILSRLETSEWKNDAERDDLLRRLAAIPGLPPEEIGWMAGESNDAIRLAGLAMLRRLPFEQASEAIFPLLSSRTEQTRIRAIASLETLGGDRYHDRIPGFLAHPDPGVVLAGLDWLERYPLEAGLDWIVPALSSTAAVRRKAFRIVESIPSPKTAQIALAALDSEDPDLRLRAIGVLVRYPSPEHIEPLLRRCSDSARIQDAAIAAVTPLISGDEDRFDDLILPLIGAVNPKIRQMAMAALSKRDPQRVADSFLQGFGSNYSLARDRAIEGLRALGPRFIQAFLERDNDQNPGVAALASSIAVAMRTPEVVSHCIEYLTGPDWWLRDRAAQALAEIRDERGLPALLHMLEDPESDISAAAALGVWGTPQALPGLLGGFKKGTRDLRLEILEAFGKIPDPRLPPLLEQIIKTVTDPLIREKATRILAHRAGDVPFYENLPPLGTRFEPLDFTRPFEPTMVDLFRHARAVNASDLHIAVGTRPHIRVTGRLTPLPLPESTPEQMEAWIPPLLSTERRAELAQRRQIDFCYKDSELGRFRTNVFYQRKGLNAVFRLVPFEIPTLSEVGLPESLWELATFTQGLLLVTGPAGCGKTTTLAALINRINETQRLHILTIEDPIEYVHLMKESLINQREVPSHSGSFAKALRQSLREDPDVILVGEMRDLETISLAITASETGHLVLGTLHTATAAATVDRIINAFPPDQQGQIRMMISDSLKVVLSQALLPRRDGAGRVAAFEVLRNTGNVAGLIREGKTFQIPTAMQTGGASGMMLMDTALMNLVNEGTIEPREAYNRALRKESFEPFLAEEEAET